MNKNEKITNKLTEIRGKVIGECIEIDGMLTVDITNYFFKKNSQQKTLFYWLILNTRKFELEDKIQLFEKIDYFKKRKYYIKVKESLRYIQQLRNKLAHWELIVNKSKPEAIVLRDTIKVNDFILTNQVVNDFEKHKDYLMKFFTRLR